MRIAFISPNREQMPDAVIPIGLLYVMASTPARHEKLFWDLCFEPDPLATVARNLRDHGWRVVGWNCHGEVADSVAEEGGGFVAAPSLRDLATALEPPRVIWLMVPAAAPVDQLLFGDEGAGGLAELLAPGDNRKFILAYLVALRQIRIEVIFSGEPDVSGNLAVHCKSCLDGKFKRLFV